jgi:hypothetical protein
LFDTGMTNGFDGAGEMPGVFLPERPHHSTARFAISLVPDSDVALNEGLDVGHGFLLIAVSGRICRRAGPSAMTSKVIAPRPPKPVALATGIVGLRLPGLSCRDGMYLSNRIERPRAIPKI